MITSEELRVSALAASANRGKWVARRRIYWRWFSWISWRYVLPVIGLFAVMASLLCLIFWLYLGQDKAYLTAQKWVQQEFGSAQIEIQSQKNTEHPDMNHHAAPAFELASPNSATGEAALNLRIDRHLAIKIIP